MAEREYRSTLRQEQAAQTRERIVGAARDLFAAEGFAATTVAAIARAAGVAAPTVYATLGSKAGIVEALLARLEDDADTPESSRAAITAEIDPRRALVLYARWHRTLFSAGRDVLAAADEARGDPAVRALNEQGDRTARRWHTALVATLADAGALRPDLTEEHAVGIVLAVCVSELYLRVTRVCGWDDDAYEAFLTDLLFSQLLGQSPGGEGWSGTGSRSRAKPNRSR
jgi:AcrR family transcriptional regulator